MDDLVLRLRQASRIVSAFACFWAVLATAVVAAEIADAITGPSVYDIVVVVLIPVALVVAVILARNGYLLGAACRHGQITVRNYLRVIRIPVGRITRVDTIVADIYWRDSSGTERRTPVAAFKTWSAAARPQNEQAMRQLHDWWAANRPHAS